MEQNTQSNENNNQAENNVGGGQIFNEPRKKSSKKIVLLVGVIMIILGAVALYFLFFSNKEDNNIPAVENEKNEEVEIDKELDSDQDGLPDYIEEVLGTDANNSDTDGDGYSDFEEIKNGYNPLGDEKYTEEEWEVVKEEVRSGDEKLYKSIFVTEDEREIKNAFKSYTESFATSDMKTFLDTVTLKSKVELDNLLVSREYEIEQFENANYVIIERNEKYAVMIPKFREQEYENGRKKEMPNIYFEYEENAWKVDHILVQIDAIVRDDFNPEETEKRMKVFIHGWRSGKSLPQW